MTNQGRSTGRPTSNPEEDDMANKKQAEVKECPQCHGHGVWDIYASPLVTCTKCSGAGTVQR